MEMVMARTEITDGIGRCPELAAGVTGRVEPLGWIAAAAGLVLPLD